MVNHKEILRLKSLGFTHREIADATGCGRNTVTRTLARAREQQLSWQQAQSMSQQEVSQRLFPMEQKNPVYKMPDYEWVHREMQKSGVTLSLLWVEYCEQCRQNGELPYKSTQFNKYYADYVHKTKATMHLEHKPGETMQVDWAGQTAALVDTDTGEELDAYLFVAVLPYSGYAYTEAFLDMKQEAWITGHVNAYRYFGGVTRILTSDNLKTGVVKNSRTETVLNKTYQEMAEHYGKTPAQICIKWNLQHGFLPLSKSVNEDRMRANLEVENFEIAEEDMRKLDVLEGFADGNDPDKVPF